MKNLKTAAIIVLALTAGALASAVLPHRAPPVVTECQESDPCWDCSTMGNRVCGPLTVVRNHGTLELYGADGERMTYARVSDRPWGYIFYASDGTIVGVVGWEAVTDNNEEG